MFSVFQALCRHSQEHPESPALIDIQDKPVIVTAAEIVDQISRRTDTLAADLDKFGVVGQYPRNGVDTIIDCLALEGLGIPSIQIASADDAPPSFVSHVINTDGTLRSVSAHHSMWPLSMSASGERLIRLANTSGTTGTPKSIAFSRAMVETRLQEYQQIFGSLLGGSDKILTYMGLSSPLGYFMLCLAMTLGKAFVVNVGRGVLRENPTTRLHCPFVLISPASCAELWTATKIGLHPIFKFSNVVLGGAPCSSSLRQQIRDVLQAEAYSLFGSAEAGPLAFAIASELNLDVGEVGKLRQGCTLLQSDRPGERRTALFAAPCVAPYVDDQILATGTVHPIKTWQSSDVCRVGPTGVLTCEGRLSFMLNIGGDKFNIDDIERRIVALGSVKAVCVIPVFDALGVQRLALFVHPAVSFDRATFEARFRAELPPLLFPILFFEVDAMPLGPTGKINREKLRKLAGI